MSTKFLKHYLLAFIRTCHESNTLRTSQALRIRSDLLLSWHTRSNTGILDFKLNFFLELINFLLAHLDKKSSHSGLLNVNLLDSFVSHSFHYTIDFETKGKSWCLLSLHFRCHHECNAQAQIHQHSNSFLLLQCTQLQGT